jgi:hypothetical protein
MHNRTNGYISQWQTVTRFDSRITTALDRITSAQALGRNDVTSFTVGIKHQRDMRSPIRIMLNALNETTDTILVTLEINNAVMLFVTTATMARRYTTGVIATTGA